MKIPTFPENIASKPQNTENTNSDENSLTLSHLHDLYRISRINEIATSS